MKRLARVACIFLTIPCLMAESDPPIIEAARGGDTTRLRQILKTRQALHARGSQNQSALHEAARACSLEAAQLLVDAGIDKLLCDSASRTANMIPMRCPSSDSTNHLVRLMLVRPAPKPMDETLRWSLHDASARGNVEVVNMLLSLGIDVNEVDTKGNRAVEIACRAGNVQLTQRLLQAGADPRIKTNAGTTLLHEAALGGSAAVIEILIERGADIDARDTDTGATPLHYAASFGRTDAVKVLIKHRASLNIRIVRAKPRF
ncbi:MAG TPA: ankyrin repeat domain-containing protein [Bryobacteraceae bacterium]|nr:ankyrin repeat domain-containing protein [Bryobacteraceae bacterium]